MGNFSKISLTIADDKVTAYSYRGAKLGAASSKPAAETSAFGDGTNYSIVLKRVGDRAPNGTYRSRHGVAAAKLTRE